MTSWGIRARVLFLALAPAVLILLTLVTYFTYDRIAEVDRSLARHGIALARQLAPGAEFALFAGDRTTLQHLVDVAAAEADVVEIAVADADGQVLARHTTQVLPEGDVLRFAQAVTQTRLPSSEFPDQSAASAPLRVGEIRVGMSRTAAHAEQRRLLIVGLALGLACVLLAVGLALFIGNSVIEPIQQLAQAMEAVGRGQRVSPLPLAGGGEFRTLAAEFNDMARRLAADTEELQRRVDDATAALLAQKDAAVQATAAKSRFLAAASHDLRQPLHAIGLFTSTLERRTRNTDLAAVVADLVEAVAVMERLFDALLDISKLDSGAIQVEHKAFPIARLFNHLATEHADALAARSLRMVMRPGSYAVVSDELLLHRLLSNLIANAIRYTPAGTVLVACRGRGDEVQIEVRDNGIGIAADQQAEIFQEFYQIDNPARDRSRGLGLGLAIVSRIAKLLDTAVAVRSAPGRGSVFSVRLPRTFAAPKELAMDTAVGATAAEGAALCVIVVDDDPLVLAANRGLFEDARCEVITVSDGESAAAALRSLQGRAALVLCDLWLANGESGIAVLQHLAALTASPFCGIVISGDTRPETIHAVGAAGFSLLHKPVAASKLRALVMQFDARVRDDENPAR